MRIFVELAAAQFLGGQHGPFRTERARTAKIRREFIRSAQHPWIWRLGVGLRKPFIHSTLERSRYGWDPARRDCPAAPAGPLRQAAECADEGGHAHLAYLIARHFGPVDPLQPRGTQEQEPGTHGDDQQRMGGRRCSSAPRIRSSWTRLSRSMIATTSGSALAAPRCTARAAWELA